MSSPINTPLGPISLQLLGPSTSPPILILHGSPGGIDAAEAMSRFLLPPTSSSSSPSSSISSSSPPQTFQLILVSRPGYLSTPLHPSNPSIDHEADLLASALDTLSIPRVGILAWSGGGPAAYRLAARHPEKVNGMVILAGVSQRWIAPEPDLTTRFLFGTGIGGKVVGMLCKYAPRQVVGGALEGEGSLRGEGLRELVEETMRVEERRELVLAIAGTVSTAGRRREGWRNDVRNFGEIEDLELGRIKCGVLLVHGDGDTDAGIEHSRFAEERIEGSEIVVMEGGTHLCFYAHPRAEEVQGRVREWFLKHAAI